MRIVLLFLILITTFTLCAESLYIASSGKSPGIYYSELDVKTGQLKAASLIVPELKTGFLAKHPSKNIIYAHCTEKAKKGELNASIRAYQIVKPGKLEFISKVMVNDFGNTHIEVSRNAKYIAVCHYGGKGTSVVALKDDGALLNKVSQVEHTGSSVNPKRQRRPHPHGVAIHPNEAYVCVADLGNDHVEVFKVSKDIVISKSSFWKAKPGAGPRHLAFHPNGKWLYCINELDSTMALLHFDENKGELKEVQVLSTLPDTFKEWNSTAEVLVDPNGKFLYGSNRGHNSTAVFKIDQQNGKLSFVEREPTGGDHPRFVGMNPSGTIFIAANMKSDMIKSFKINSSTGELKDTGFSAGVKRPMCVLFVP